jgi:hypothetical protein
MKRLSMHEGKNSAVLRLGAGALAVVVACGAVLGCGGGDKGGTKQVASYGAKVKVPEGEKVKFRDFSVKFTGTSQEKNAKAASGTTYYNYKLRKGDERKVISWSGGSGAPAPLKFDFNDGKYSLERVQSQKLGKLAEDEIVVWNLNE